MMSIFSLNLHFAFCNFHFSMKLSAAERLNFDNTEAKIGGDCGKGLSDFLQFLACPVGLIRFGKALDDFF